VSRLALCVVLATATDPVAATKSKTAMNQTACKRFIRASPSVRGGCHVEWLSALPASVLDVVAEDWPEVRGTTVDVGLCQRMRTECAASTGMSGMHQMRPALVRTSRRRETAAAPQVSDIGVGGA